MLSAIAVAKRQVGYRFEDAQSEDRLAVAPPPPAILLPRQELRAWHPQRPEGSRCPLIAYTLLMKGTLPSSHERCLWRDRALP